MVEYSVLTFYAIIVLAVGRIIRSVLAGQTEALFITEVPRPDRLLILCEGVIISRMERRLDREEELFFVLIDILRSPEILKIITQSSLSLKKKIE